MSRVVRNVLANVIGGGWGIVLSLVAVPIQISILGTEAYGLIGFITALQVILVIFDLGLPTTIIREVSINHETDRYFSRTLVQISSTIYWIAALLLGGAVILAADWISTEWLTVQTLSPVIVAQSLRLLALYIIFTWPVNIYSSALAGLQRFDLINLFRFLNSTFNRLGGIIVLMLTRDLQSFILWIVINAFVFLVLHLWMCYRLIPELTLRPAISLPVIKRVWKFSFDLNLISTTAIIFTQSDRILISALLPLQTLGYYNAAYDISRQINALQDFLNSAVMPTLAVKVKENIQRELEDYYLRYAQVMVYVLVPPTMVMIFFGYHVLEIWAGTDIAANSALVLAILIIGFMLNGSLTTNYTLAIASGQSRRILWINVIALFVYVPAITYLIVNHGMIGAAVGWVLLNLYYLAVLMPFTQRRILGSGADVWLREVLLPFFIAGLMIFSIGRGMESFFSLSNLWFLICLACLVIYALIGFTLLKPPVRQPVVALFNRVMGMVSLRSS